MLEFKLNHINKRGPRPFILSYTWNLYRFCEYQWLQICYRSSDINVQNYQPWSREIATDFKIHHCSSKFPNLNWTKSNTKRIYPTFHLCVFCNTVDIQRSWISRSKNSVRTSISGHDGVSDGRRFTTQIWATYQLSPNHETITMNIIIFISVWELLAPVLTHWGRVTHICVGKLTILGSDNGLSPGRRQAIIWTNAGILSIGPLGTNFSEILIKLHAFYARKCVWKCRLGNGGHLVSASMC